MGGLREALNVFEAAGGLIHVTKEVSTRYEVARILAERCDDSIVVFDRIAGFRNKIVANVCSSKRRLAQGMDVRESKLYDVFTSAAASPVQPRISSGYDSEMKEQDPSLKNLPILTHFPRDPGPYLTSAIVSTRDPEGAENISIHRMLVIDDKHLAIRIVPRHLYRITQMAKKLGKKSLDVGVAIGVDPAVLLAASAPVPFGVSEYSVANAMMNGSLSLVQCSNADVNVPAGSEVVLEGQILLDRETDEGPFVDLTGTYDVVRKQPVIEIEKMFVRDNYIYQALLPGGAEHKTLMGFPYETRIWSALKTTIPGVKEVTLTPGGCGWLHAVISIQKQTEGDGKNALLAAFGAHPSLKHAVVVDEDIDVNNPSDIEWAIATRFRADKGLVVIDNVRGSSLDPSADQTTLVGAKMGLDATRSLSKPKEKFEKAKITEP